MDCQGPLPGRARTRQRFPQARFQLALPAAHEALPLVEERTQPGEVGLLDEVGHRLVPADAKSEQ